MQRPQPCNTPPATAAHFAAHLLCDIRTPRTLSHHDANTTHHLRHTTSGTLESVANELSYRVSLTSQGAAKELTYDRRRRMLPLWRWDEIRYSKHRKYRKYVRRMLPLWRWEEVG